MLHRQNALSYFLDPKRKKTDVFFMILIKTKTRRADIYTTNSILKVNCHEYIQHWTVIKENISEYVLWIFQFV